MMRRDPEVEALRERILELEEQLKAEGQYRMKAEQRITELEETVARFEAELRIPNFYLPPTQ